MLSQEDIRELPVVVEFVSVPSTFDVELYLTMRETIGIFQGKETYLEHVKFIAETVRASPWFVLAKCPDITIQSAFMCLELFRQIGLTLDTNDSNAMQSKLLGRDWRRESEHWQYSRNEGGVLYEQGHISQLAYVMVIVNVYKIVEDGFMKGIIEKVVEVEDRVVQAEEAAALLDDKKK